MKPNWFRDTIPLDPLIAPMVLFFRNNGIITINSCEGGINHLYGRPTIGFEASSLDDIDKVYSILHSNDLDTSLEIGLMTGYFSSKYGGRYGKASWLWNGEEEPLFKELVYDRVIQLVDMNNIEYITHDLDKWRQMGRPSFENLREIKSK